MFTKIHYKFYDVLFELYGKLAEFCSMKMKQDEVHKDFWRRRLERCIYVREDILDIMFTFKGLN